MQASRIFQTILQYHLRCYTKYRCNLKYKLKLHVCSHAVKIFSFVQDKRHENINSTAIRHCYKSKKKPMPRRKNNLSFQSPSPFLPPDPPPASLHTWNAATDLSRIQNSLSCATEVTYTNSTDNCNCYSIEKTSRQEGKTIFIRQHLRPPPSLPSDTPPASPPTVSVYIHETSQRTSSRKTLVYHV